MWNLCCLCCEFNCESPCTVSRRWLLLPDPDSDEVLKSKLEQVWTQQDLQWRTWATNQDPYQGPDCQLLAPIIEHTQKLTYLWYISDMLAVYRTKAQKKAASTGFGIMNIDSNTFLVECRCFPGVCPLSGWVWKDDLLFLVLIWTLAFFTPSGFMNETQSVRNVCSQRGSTELLAATSHTHCCRCVWKQEGSVFKRTKRWMSV